MTSITNNPQVVSSAPQRSKNYRLIALSLLLVIGAATQTGCTSILSPIHGVPANRVPPQFLKSPEANFEPVDLTRLRRDPPKQYLLGPGDVLGIFIEGVLGTAEEAPPVHFRDKETSSSLPPALGFPIPIREDGTLSLPLIEPINLEGLTLAQAENAIRRAYTLDRSILQPGRDRIIVTLVEERTIQVIVVRQDGGRDGTPRNNNNQTRRTVRETSEQQGHGYIVNLKAYQNDLLHALAETGGLPGRAAKNEIKIMRGRLADTEKRDRFVREFYQQQALLDPCLCPPPLPDDPSVIRIPLRLPPGEVPSFQPKDIILEEGDIVYIESREAEIFYAGGLLTGGEFQLPRDYDLDVLGAIAMAGGGGGPRGGGGILGGSFDGVPPTQLFVLRRTPCGGQVTIAVDLVAAVNNPRERILVQPGDTLILRYKCQEEVLNFSLLYFFVQGINRAFR